MPGNWIGNEAKPAPAVMDEKAALEQMQASVADAAGQLYAGLPVVGWLVRGLRRLLSAGV